MKDTYYSISEIYRRGLLKNYKGEPYKSRSAVSIATRGLPCKIEKGPFGDSRKIAKSEIDRFNKRWKV